MNNPAKTHKNRLTAVGLTRLELWVTDPDKAKIKSEYEKTESYKIKAETTRKWERNQMRLFRDYLEELEHPVEQLADFPQREIDVATAKYLECQPPNGVFNIVSEAWLDYDPESDHGSLTKIAEMVRDGEIDKIKGYDMIFENLRSASEVQINDEINTFNEA